MVRAGGHLQTLYARQLANAYSVSYRRQRWETPDDDFVDVDWLDDAGPVGKILVLFHGLEGCSRRHYVVSLMATARKHGWRGVVPHFRGCSGAANRLMRSYHSAIPARSIGFSAGSRTITPLSEIYAVGVSLGGNMLLKWLGEEGWGAPSVVQRAVAVSVPMDLAAAARQLDFGLNRILYTRHFMRSLRPKVLAKISTHGLAIDAQAVRACATFREFDNVYTAPFHGFENADDYWRRASSKPWLKKIQVPTLLINARNDPFCRLPRFRLKRKFLVHVVMIPETGGSGIVGAKCPGQLEWLLGHSAFFAKFMA